MDWTESPRWIYEQEMQVLITNNLLTSMAMKEGD